MKPTFIHLTAPQGLFPLYGEQAYKVLKAMYTSSVFRDEYCYKWHLFRVKDDPSQKFSMMESQVGCAHWLIPVVGADGRVGVAVKNYFGFEEGRRADYLKIVTDDVKLFIKTLQRFWPRPDKDLFVFPADSGDVELSLGDFKLMLVLLQRNGVPSARMSKMYKEWIGKFIGRPCNPLEAAKVKTTTDSTRDAIVAAVNKLNGILSKKTWSEKAAIGQAECKKLYRPAYEECVRTIRAAFRKAADVIGATEEEIIETEARAIENVPEW